MTLASPYFTRFLGQAVGLLALLGTSPLAPIQTIRYVRTDGTHTTPATATSTTNLQGAINASASGDQVLAGVMEQVSLPLRTNNGGLLVIVSTFTQYQHIKLLTF